MVFAFAGAALLLLLALKLRGPSGGRDLTGPPKRRGRVFGPAEAGLIADLVASGERAEALRLMRRAGHEEAEAVKLIALVERLAGDGDGAGEKALP